MLHGPPGSLPPPPYGAPPPRLPFPGGPPQLPGVPPSSMPPMSSAPMSSATMPPAPIPPMPPVSMAQVLPPGLEPPPPGMSPPPRTQGPPPPLIQHPLPGSMPPMTSAPPRIPPPPGPVALPGSAPGIVPGQRGPPPLMSVAPPVNSGRPEGPPGMSMGAPRAGPPVTQPLPNHPPNGAPGSTLMDFFSDKWAPKPGLPYPYGAPPPHHIPPHQLPPHQLPPLPGHPLPPSQSMPPMIPGIPPQGHPPYYGAAPPLDPHFQSHPPPQLLPHLPPQPLMGPGYDARGPPTHSRQPAGESRGRRFRRSHSRDSDSSLSRSPTPPRSPLRTSGRSSRDRYGRRRKRSRSLDRRERRYHSPDNYVHRRGPRTDELRRERSANSSPVRFNNPDSGITSLPVRSNVPDSAAPTNLVPIAATPTELVSTIPVVEATTSKSATSAVVSTTVATPSTASVAATSTSAVPAAAATSSMPAKSTTPPPETVSAPSDSAPTDSVPTDLGPTEEKSGGSEEIPSLAKEPSPQTPEPSAESASTDATSAEKSSEESASATMPSTNVPSTTTEKAVSSEEAAALKEKAEEEALLLSEGEIDVAADILELGVEEDELLAEVQSEEQNSQSESTAASTKTKRVRRLSEDEYRQRRENRWYQRQEEERERERLRRQRQEEDRRQREEERRRMEERERRRREREREDELNRNVGRGKTLPDRPSVVKLSAAAKAKSSGDEASDLPTSQAQSPVQDLEIMDEDAMLAMFRERALKSMRDKQREKFLKAKEQRRLERLQQAKEEPKKRKSDEPIPTVTTQMSAEEAASKRKRLGPLAAAALLEKPSKPAEAAKTRTVKKPLTKEEEEEALLMSTDDDDDDDDFNADSKEESDSVPKVEEKRSVTPPVTAPSNREVRKPKPTIARITGPSPNKTESSNVQTATTTKTKKMISLKSSKWSKEKEEAAEKNVGPIKTKLSLVSRQTKREVTPPEKVVEEERVVSKEVIPERQRKTSGKLSKKAQSALDRLGAPVEDESSSDSVTTSSSSSSSVEDQAEASQSQPRASVVKLAASVKSVDSKPIRAYALRQSSPEVAFNASDSESAEVRWSEAVAQAKSRKNDALKSAENKAISGREPISYEDLDAVYSHDVAKTRKPSPIKDVASATRFSDSPLRLSPSTKEDIRDLLELTAPMTPPAKTSSASKDVNAEKLLDGINFPDTASVLGKKRGPTQITRPTWGRRRVEAPDSSSSSSSTSRKLVIRRSTGPAAVALATGGDAQAEIEARKRRKMLRGPVDEDEGSEPMSDTRDSTPEPRVKSPVRRKLGGIQRPTWLASKSASTLATNTAGSKPTSTSPVKPASPVQPIPTASPVKETVSQPKLPSSPEKPNDDHGPQNIVHNPVHKTDYPPPTSLDREDVAHPTPVVQTTPLIASARSHSTPTISQPRPEVEPSKEVVASVDEEDDFAAFDEDDDLGVKTSDEKAEVKSGALDDDDEDLFRAIDEFLN